ncbi:MAG: Protein-export membrane protein SecD [Candidatus Tokpelaia sp. JSC189]|nr:MAG: Protein-export membrane protein SecD [Candidatus Tokpelaia sp. JSC189]
MRTPRWLVIFYSIILIAGVLIALPNLFTPEQLKKYVPFLPDTRVTLGLDLRGGSSLQLEIDTDTLKRDRLRNLLNSVRLSLRTEQIQPRSVRIVKDTVVVTIPDETERQKAAKTFESLISPVSKGVFSTPLNDLAITQDNESIHITLTDSAINYHINNAITQSLEIIRQRVDKVGVTEPSIQKVGQKRIQVQLPGLKDPTQLRTLLGTTAKMTFHLVRSDVDINNPPPGVSVLPSYKEHSMEHYAIEDKVSLDGAFLENAQSAYEQSTNRPMITFVFNSQGAKEFAKITRENLGRSFAIVLDNKVLTAPVIQSVIPNGRGQITGQFTSSETVTLAALLRAGALPAPLKIIEERTVGPELGADSIKMGLYTGVIGFILVAVFIFLLYGLWGIIADLALALHTILTFSALSLLGATLTLPGIAGIILGIGIAVDANILINERIREESRKGVGAFAALDRGFRRAFSTIVDSNITIVIATALLWYFGTGPVRGFALTMLLGIVISLFTDVTIVHIIMNWVVRRWKMKVLKIQPFLNFIPQHTNFCFMNARFIGIMVSILLSVSSIFLFFKPGLNYGIDFKGGIQLEVNTKEAIDLSTLRSTLSSLQLGEIALQNLGNDNTIMIRVQRQTGDENTQTAAVIRIKEAVQKLYPDSNFPRTEMVGPQISGELTKNGFKAVFFASIAMTFYVWMRFEWFFAVGAIVTLILDTTKMIGIIVLFQFDFNLTAIAALMTIVGYSVNDKIVVYDRMRENLHLFRKTSLRGIIDMSINQVLIRCIFTSMTTVLAMLPMANWGGNTVHNFALPIVIGVIVATSSSIFIAAPILLFLGNWWKQHCRQKDEKCLQQANFETKK